MNFYPKGYFNKVSEITLEYIKENNIKGLILDVDNTLIDYYKNMTEETVQWANMLKENGVKLCILSNSNRKEKVREVAGKIGVEYKYFGMKPLKKGFKKAKKMLNIDNNSEIAVVGDQIFTDVLGANRMKMHSILVNPIEEKDIWITLIKRPIENCIKNKYMQKSNKNNNIPDKQNTINAYKIHVDGNIVSTKTKKEQETKEERDVF